MLNENSNLTNIEDQSYQDLYKEIQVAYLSDNRPWIIGYSGGKDSTATLQLVWNALLILPPEKRTKHVYVISSDTLVETPLISKYLQVNIGKINEAAKKQKLPITAELVVPVLNDTYWVNLLGRGYPAPQQRFRWCTERLKIRTSNKYIQEKISKSGEVVIVLGLRKAESYSRAQVMKKRKIKDSIFSQHSNFSGARVYAPIRDWSVLDVWDYLLIESSPWGGDNKELARMYKDADGECPFVVDDTTPPCGNSRFGCWVCTLVQRDKMMESLVQSGEGWMLPLLEFRDLLASTQDPSVKHLYRDYKRRQGFVSFKSDLSGEISRGPYTFNFRKELLTKLLMTQVKIRKIGPDPSISLISMDELNKIRHLWRTEEGDWDDSVYKICQSILGEEVIWESDDVNPFKKADKETLIAICENNDVPLKLVVKLIDVELQTQGMTRRSSIFSQINKVFREEWRSEEEVKQDYKERQKEQY